MKLAEKAETGSKVPALLREAGIDAGRYLSLSKDCPEALIGDPQTPFEVKLYLVGLMHTQGFLGVRPTHRHPSGFYQVELAVKLVRSRQVPQTAADFAQDIEDLTAAFYERNGHPISDKQAKNFRPSRQLLRRGFESLERRGYLARVTQDGLILSDLPPRERQKAAGSQKMLHYFFVKPRKSMASLPEVDKFVYLKTISLDDSTAYVVGAATSLGIAIKAEQLSLFQSFIDPLKQITDRLAAARQDEKAARQRRKEAENLFKKAAESILAGNFQPAGAAPAQEAPAAAADARPAPERRRPASPPAAPGAPAAPAPPLSASPAPLAPAAAAVAAPGGTVRTGAPGLNPKPTPRAADADSAAQQIAERSGVLSVKAAGEIHRRALALNPTVTPDDIIGLIDLKLDEVREARIRGRIGNLTGLLVKYVPEMAQGPLLAMVRTGNTPKRPTDRMRDVPQQGPMQPGKWSEPSPEETKLSAELDQLDRDLRKANQDLQDAGTSTLARDRAQKRIRNLQEKRTDVKAKLTSLTASRDLAELPEAV